MAGTLESWMGEEVLSALGRLLALSASSQPLSLVLDELLRFAEHLTPDMRCSILLADLSAGVLRSGAAPSLPPSYTAMTDGLPIAEGIGSCGTAAARRETVIVSDIAQSPLWRDYLDIAREHGLGACWSVPLLDTRGTLLGTCAMYYTKPRAPTAAEQDSIRITGNLAAMAIQRHRDAEELRASESRHRHLAIELAAARADLQAILDNVPARITLWDAALTNCFANRAALEALGKPKAEVIGRPLSDIVDEALYRRTKPIFEEVLTGERRSCEATATAADGAPRFSCVDFIPKRRDGVVVGLYAFSTDVTEVRLSYQRVRELAQRLETIREEERRSVAEVLHESVAQDLFAMRLAVDQLRTRAADPAAVSLACQELALTLDHCMSATRQVANDLQPLALAHLPLSAALREHARYFGAVAGLRITVTERAPDLSLDVDTRRILFRAAQEALTNVARHAKATQVDIVLRAADDALTMEISDNGIGVEEGSLSKPGAFGLLGIRERVAALGGTLAVRKGARRGTTVTVHLPLAAEAAWSGVDPMARARAK